MRILIPIFGFAPSGGGRVLSELSNSWIRLGHEVTFIAFSYSKSPHFPTNAKIIWINSRGNVSLSNNDNSKRFPLDVLYFRQKLKSAIEKFGLDFDVILASHSFTAFPVYKAKVKAKKFYYIQAYEPEFYTEGLLATFYKKIALNSYQYNLRTIVNAEIYKSYKEIRSEIVIPPGIDREIFFPKMGQLNRKVNLKIGCIGRLQKWKGTQLVLDAFKILERKYEELELYIAYGNIELDNQKNVNIITPKNDKELADFYRSIDVLVAPGAIQLGAHHYPVLEAMSCGTVVITTGYSGANKNNAFIVAVNDAIQIANALEEILKFPEIANNKKNKAFNNLTNHSWETVSNNMMNYFINS